MSNQLPLPETDIGGPSGGRILVVEDDAPVLLLISRILADAGYDYATATSVAEALQHLDVEPTDVVLSDVGLPDGSGVELAQQIRERYPDVAMIMVTGADDPEVASAALDSGAAGYVTKPFRANDILIAVLQGLAHRDRDRERRRAEGVDRVTGLPDRVASLAALEQALEQAARQRARFGVLVVDCDRFRAINDVLGHAAGDELLSIVGRRLRRVVRSSDLVGRWSADTYLLICTDVTNEHEAATIADRVSAALRHPVALYERELVVDVSIGVAIAHDGHTSAETLVREAQIALDHAKRAGGGIHRVFEPGMREDWMRRLSMESDLRGALERGDLRLFYQPIIDLETGKLTAFEALIRWEHPDQGLVLPGRFIPLAEESGLIVDIGRWVLREACRQLAAWSAAPGRDEPVGISVNVSGRQFAQPDFVDDVFDAIEAAGIDPTRLGLEITEGMAIEGESAQSAIYSLQQRGVRILLDDFGTGYSVLSSIQRYAVNALKVDRTFVSALEGEGDAALVEAIVSMGRSLGLAIVAEGIETHHQLRVLRSLGCGFGQGYLFARPMPSRDAARILRDQRAWHDVVVEADHAAPAALVPPTAGSNGGPAASAPPAHPSPDEVVRLTDAADMLGVSTSTVRRWADSGRLRTVRTPGGHRRLLEEDVMRLNDRLGRGRNVGPIRRAEPPVEPLPELSDLLNLHSADLVSAVARRLYPEGSPGWFGSDAAGAALRDWSAALATASRSGRYELAQAATTTLMGRAHLAGTSLLERHGFLERFAENAVRMLEREHPRARVAASQRLFRVLGDALLDQ